MSPGAPTLKPLCPTRWTVRTKAIDAVLKTTVLFDELEIVEGLLFNESKWLYTLIHFIYLFFYE